MTRSNRPRTTHQLLALMMGRPLTPKEVTKAGPDRVLNEQEARGLKQMRVKQAAKDRLSPQRVLPRGVNPLDVTPAGEEKPVAYYTRAVSRFERWARRAERLGLDKSRPPAHVARMALDVVNMAKPQTEGGAA